LAIEYGLIASRSAAIISDFFWQLEAAWNSTPLWGVITAGLGFAALCFFFFKKR
jgi:hypothetical protein